MKRELKQLLREKGSTAKRRMKSILGFGVAASPKKGRPEIPIWIPEDHPCRTNQFERALWHQFFEGPLPFFLNQYDRCSMANGVEARMPFMDYRVVEYVFSLPLQARVGHGYTKRVLREAVKGILPDAIRLNRRKTGFNAPFNEWLQGPLHGWAMDLASTPEFMENTCFDGREMSSLIRKSGFNGAGPMHEREIWPALHMAWWLRNRRTL